MAHAQRLAGETGAGFMDPDRASPQGSEPERAIALDDPEHERSFSLFVWLMTRFGVVWLVLVAALVYFYTT